MVLIVSTAKINFVKNETPGLIATNESRMRNFLIIYVFVVKTTTTMDQRIRASLATLLASIALVHCSITARCVLRVPICTMIAIYVRRHAHLDSRLMIHIGHVVVIQVQCFS